MSGMTERERERTPLNKREYGKIRMKIERESLGEKKIDEEIPSVSPPAIALCVHSVFESAVQQEILHRLVLELSHTLRLGST